ncbi:MAG TPA: pectinesterase family protein [Luteibacter sp.]|uniref:pectinesterase family protein n=1 Tax=Luteibacter sp. TaxID=1886636 RepID=UPI002F3E50B5
MNPVFKRKRSPILIAQALAVMATGLSMATHAQTTTVHINRPGYFNLLDPQTTSSLIQILEVHKSSPLQELVSNPVIVAAHRGVVDIDHAENTIRSAVNTMNAGIESMELDVYESSDLVPYLMHDEKFTRMLNRPEYADIYRWQSVSNDPALKTPSWSDISRMRMCTGNDGYGLTVNSNGVCYDPANNDATFPSSLDETMVALWQDSYQGLVFLDVRQLGNIRDVAAMLANIMIIDDDYGKWVASHVVMKFQTWMFDGPHDFYQATANFYDQAYGGSLTESQLAQLLIMPVYTSNKVADNDGGGASPWALNDWNSWVNWNNQKNNVLSPEVSLKTLKGSMNHGSDDLFTLLRNNGLTIGIYVPEQLCTVASPNTSPSNLAGNAGTYWEGGICGPLSPPMNANECGDSGTTSYTSAGKGCADHRPFREFWHDSVHFGFVITDQPKETIEYLMQFPGDRPGNDVPCSSSEPCVILGSQPTLVVAADGSGAYKTITAALAAVTSAGAIIQIRPGTYHEKLTITQPNVALIGVGKDASQVTITNDDYAAKTDAAGKALGTGGSYTVKVSGNDFYAANLTIQNNADYEAPNFQANNQAVALYNIGERAVFRAVRVLGGQDTLYLGSGKRAYFSNCYVEGYVDYIFGNGKAVFDSCYIKTRVHGDLTQEATITAQNRASTVEDSGFVFNNSQLLFDSPYMTNVWLGRPWGAYATTYFLNTKMGSQVVTKGWIEFIPTPVSQGGTNNLPTSTYREYGSFYPDAGGTWTAFDISQRESTSPRSNVSLTTSEVAALQPATYLAGNDSWDPTKVTYAGDNSSQVLPLPAPAAGVPTAPSITSVTAGNGNIQVNWAGQPSNPVEQGYTLTATQNGKTFGPVTLPLYASASYIDGLANGTPATVTVREFNARGSSAPSVSASVTPVSHDPSAPDHVQVTTTTNSATVSFTLADQGAQPVFNSSVAHAGIYTALYASEADVYAGRSIAGTSNGFTTPTWTFNNLQRNTTYWVSLKAYNGNYSPMVVTSFVTRP